MGADVRVKQTELRVWCRKVCNAHAFEDGVHTYTCRR